MGGSIRFSVLGAVSVHRGETPITIGSPQQQALLVALLLRSGRVASTHELIASVWGEEPPGSALASLRTYVWRLRQLLEEDSAAPRLLLSQPDGYRMVAPPLSVDLHRAEQLAAEAGRARAGGDDEACGRLLAEALGLWQGAPLAGVPGPYAEQQRARFTELRMGLEEERFAHELQAGRYGAVIPDLTVFTQEHPLQERPYGFLMRALYASGRQADALAVYARARRVLAEELGVDPGPELTALHERVLAGDPLLDVSVRGTAPVAAAPEAPATRGVPRIRSPPRRFGPSNPTPAPLPHPTPSPPHRFWPAPPNSPPTHSTSPAAPNRSRS